MKSTHKQKRAEQRQANREASAPPKTPYNTPKKRKVIRKRRNYWLWGLFTLVCVGLVALIVWVSLPPSADGVPANEGIDGVRKFTNLSREHKDGKLPYDQNPPVGGAHNPTWQNCGIYNNPIENENGVHSLEHGAVWITYKPDLPKEQIETLKSLVKGQSYMLLSPMPGIPSPVVATAWGYQLKLDKADDPRLPEFIRQYVQGQQTPEPGAACTQGKGTPDAQ